MIRSQSGQTIIETMLIMLALISFTALVAKTFEGEQLFTQLVSGPWDRIDGMIQHGAWKAPINAMAEHPNQHNLHVTQRPN